MNDKPNSPTCEELYEEEGFEIVSEEHDTSWRHGSYEATVFRRTNDNTFWLAAYCLSNDGETNELREGLATILQVLPQETTTTVYVPV